MSFCKFTCSVSPLSTQFLPRAIPLPNSLAFQNENHALLRKGAQKNDTNPAVLPNLADGFRKSPFGRHCSVVLGGKTISLAEDEEDDDDDDDWASEMVADLERPRSRLGRQRVGNREEKQDENREEEEKQVLWSSVARERAIKAVQERELPIRSLVEDVKKRTKKKKKKSKKTLAPLVLEDISSWEALDEEQSPQDLAPLRLRDTGGEPVGEEKSTPDALQSVLGKPWAERFGSVDALRELAAGLGHMKNTGSGSWKTQLAEARQENTGKITGTVSQQFFSPSKQKRQEDYDLNRTLVSAADATEVLSMIDDVIGGAGGQDETPLSAVNVSTALHRIAKHMEAVSMDRSDRFSFARKKSMALLVSSATECLPRCSAQGVSNIAWALSKVGGYSLYASEMDLIAQVALRKISDFEPQHVANTAGAFASMQHSIPPLLKALDQRASLYCSSFQPQQLAQLLWAFATLNHPAKLLLDSLDLKFEAPLGDENDVRSLSDGLEELERPLDVSATELKATSANGWVSGKEYFERFSFSQLASLAWSYTILGELERPSFARIWNAILHQIQDGASRRVMDLPNPSLQLSQLYQTHLSLQLEHPELQFSLPEPFETLARKDWEKTKTGKKLTSVTQLDVGRLLLGIGGTWVAECTTADYSLDAALVEEKIGLEIDGPSHFARNTGEPLGHTLLKRRHLSAAGWTVLSIPYEEWDEQQGEMEQRCYLSNLLRNHM